MAQARSHVGLNVFFRAFGHHPGAWRHPDSPSSGQPDLNYWVKLAKLAEAAKFDAVFVADFVGQAGGQLDELAFQPLGYQFEPLTLMTAVAGATDKIGLIATLSANFNEPYNVARRFASLDHISGGRAGWNVVASLSPSSAKVFGIDNPLDHASRYEHAGEFLEVTKAFWDSWDDNAFGHINKQTGNYLDIASAHPVKHHGKYFNVEGLLDIARPVQGYPVIVQAGNIGAVARRRPGLLCRRQEPHGQVRPRSVGSFDHAWPVARHRRERTGGPGQAGRPAGALRLPQRCKINGLRPVRLRP
ncbi:MAG: NtaA/DmoA family FMN-dependent monooxygenase [Asticcacaulis sp.]|nr:NtaA/DmoA family FMN-dependent monooxygenase [Asticcacaulis sp.]